MTLLDRYARLADRERKLLLIFAGVLSAFTLVLLPIWIRSGVSAQADENTRLREVIIAIGDERLTIAKRAQLSETVARRYGRKAPALAGFLASTADQVKLKIPETQDRSSVPHGKTFKERLTRINMTKVGMRQLAEFMEKVTTSGYPIVISRLDIKKRGGAPDEFDAEMDVSAFDREEAKPKAKKKADE